MSIVPTYSLRFDGEFYHIDSELNGNVVTMVSFSGYISKLIEETYQNSVKYGSPGKQCFLAGVVLGIIQCAAKENANALRNTTVAESVPEQAGSAGPSSPQEGDPKAS